MYALLVHKGRHIQDDEHGQSSVEQVNILADGSVLESGNLAELLGVPGLGLIIRDEDEDISGCNE